MTSMLVLVTGLQGTGKSTIAARCADLLDAPVLAVGLGHGGADTVRACPSDTGGPRSPDVPRGGWAVMWQLSRAELQRGRSVVLDGLARSDEVTGTRALAAEHGVECLVVLTTCDDPELHRSRVDGRTRGIPGWYELSWDHVAETRRTWKPPADVDVVLDCGQPVEHNASAAPTAGSTIDNSAVTDHTIELPDGRTLGCRRPCRGGRLRRPWHAGGDGGAVVSRRPRQPARARPPRDGRHRGGAADHRHRPSRLRPLDPATRAHDRRLGARGADRG